MVLRSLRARITAAAVVAVCVAMAAVALVLVRYVRVSLEHEMDARMVADSDQVLALLPTLGQIRVEDNSVIGDPAGRSIQVLTTEGAVIGSQVYASEADRRPLLTAPFPWETEELPHTMTVDVNDGGAHRIRVTEIHGEPSRFLVVARPLSSIDNAVSTMTRALAVGLSLIVAALGWMIWLMVGRTLRPVEELRRAVSDISATDRTRRVETTDRGTEIDQLAATMNDLLDRLEIASEREHQLVADASHELRSPLAAVRALVETRTGLVGDAAAEHDTHTLAAIARLQSLIDELLDLWRYDSLTADHRPGRSAFDRDELTYRRLVDLDDLVLEQANLLRRTTPLDIDTSRVSGGQLMGNPEALRRMVENLCSNAARHASTTVRFVVEENDDAVLLEVADDGTGISEADRARVFDRFTRLADARERDQGGSGLGLAIVKGIVTSHGGTIEVADGINGTGSVFAACFPGAHGPERLDAAAAQ